MLMHRSSTSILRRSRLHCNNVRVRSICSACATGGHGLETAFELTSTALRYGEGVTSDAGWDVKHLGASRVAVVVDGALRTQHPGFTILIDSLKKHGVEYEIFDGIVVEPTKHSMEAAVEWTLGRDVDGFVAFGGGSVMDTAKVMNLYKKYPVEDFDEYVNAPVGEGTPVPGPLSPLVAIPTTAGTGSETTGVSIFDVPEIGAKTGIAHRHLKPSLGLVDPCNTYTLDRWATTFPGLDVFCHAAESYTARSYNMRAAAESPALRPAYQGSSPISDVFAIEAFKLMATNLRLINQDPENKEARKGLALASTMAGNAFGNAGVHLCHGTSYPVASAASKVSPKSYYKSVSKKLIPHGLSVALPAASVFRITGESNPEKHLELASILTGKDVNVSRHGEDAGLVFSESIRDFLDELGVPSGLGELGFTNDDIPSLVKGTLPQKRVLDVAPVEVTEELLTAVFEGAM